MEQEDILNTCFTEILKAIEGKISDKNFTYIQDNIFSFNEAVLAYEDIIWLIIDNKIKVGDDVLLNIERIADFDESFQAVFDEEKDTLYRVASTPAKDTVN